MILESLFHWVSITIHVTIGMTVSGGLVGRLNKWLCAVNPSAWYFLLRLVTFQKVMLTGGLSSIGELGSSLISEIESFNYCAHCINNQRDIWWLRIEFSWRATLIFSNGCPGSC